MGKRQYKITEDSLGAYMKHNYLKETAIVGETEHGILVQNGSKVQQIPKNNIEAWCLNNGLVPGQGVDAMSDMDKAIYKGNRARNTDVRAEAAAREASTKDSNLQAYHAQKKDTIRANAQHEAKVRNMDDGVDISKVALGGKSYPKGSKGSNQ